ncbi:tyrosine-protein phosphatase [bacterium]|nr:tyrosine-protein phosphatase [bacterium]
MEIGIFLDRICKTTIKLSFGKSLKNRRIVYSEENFPHHSDQSANLITTDGSELLIENLDPKKRLFFTIQTRESGWVELAEKRILLEGAVNFRDMGGYRNIKQEVIKWGTLFRADSLHRLSDDDLKILSSLNLKTVIDFRSEKEVKKSPDRLPEDPSIKYVHLPIKSGEFDFSTAMQLLANQDSQWPTGDFMVKNYESYLNQFSIIWKQVFVLLADSNNYPLVFHCTAGKDRTGACAALIMLLLKIPVEEIILDHQLSNKYIASIVESLKLSFKDLGEQYNKLDPFLTAPLNAINRFLKLLEVKYGTVESFLIKKVGLNPDLLKKIRENLLKPTDQTKA